MRKPLLKSSASVTLMYTASFLLCAVFGAILVQIGTPGNYVNLIMLALLVGGYIFSGMFGKTMLLMSFQSAERSGNAVYIGQAIATGVISSGIFVLLAGQFYNTGTDALTLFSGVILGLAIMTILFSAAINRSQATTLAGMIAGREGSIPGRVVILGIVFITSLLLIHVQLSAIGKISELYFDVPERIGILLAVFSIGFCLLMGGMRSLTLMRTIAYPIIAITFLVPVIWIAYKLTGNPIPQFSFGVGALQSIAEIDQQILDAGFVEAEDIFDITSDGADYDFFNHLAALVSIALATAAMPHLLQHFTTLPRASRARSAGLWSMIFIAIIFTAIPAIAAFAKLDVYTTLLGLQLSELEREASWVFGLSNPDGVALITICNEYVTSTAQAVAACGQSADYFLSPSDIGMQTNYLLLASPALNELPGLLTTMLAIGALFAIWTTTDGLVFVIANSISEDGYKETLRNKAPTGSRLFVARIFIVLILMLSTYVVFNNIMNAELAFAACFALLAASIFPALVFTVWTKGVAHSHIMYGTVTGFLFVCVALYMTQFGYDMAMNSGDEVTFRIPMVTDAVQPLGLGLLGALLCAGVTTGLSKYTNRPKKEADVDVPA